MITLTKKFCVYVDFIEKDDEFIPGYVGKGNQGRVNCKIRNKQHRDYATKYEWKRVVGYETDNEGEAFEVEMLLVRELHTYVQDSRKTSYACNQTLGGEGQSGMIMSEVTREKHSKKSKEMWAIPNFMKKWLKNKRVQNRIELKEHQRSVQTGKKRSEQALQNSIIGCNRSDVRQRNSEFQLIQQNKPEVKKQIDNVQLRCGKIPNTLRR